MIRQTRTFALLELSGPAFEEVKGKLTAAGYAQAFTEIDGKPVIDMHGIAVVCETEATRCQCGHEKADHSYVTNGAFLGCGGLGNTCRCHGFKAGEL